MEVDTYQSSRCMCCVLPKARWRDWKTLSLSVHCETSYVPTLPLLDFHSVLPTFTSEHPLSSEYLLPSECLFTSLQKGSCVFFLDVIHYLLIDQVSQNLKRIVII
jgi:hypothetical protein